MSITHAKVAADPEVPLLNDADWNAAHVGAPTLAEVLAAGNDPGPHAIQAANDVDATGAGVGFQGGGSGTGGILTMYGGDGDQNNGPYGAIARAWPGSVGVAGGSYKINAGDGGTGDEAGGDFVVTPGAGVGAGRHGLVFLNLPTSDPAVAGALWNNAGVVMVSSG